jgi:hypothetical protein
MFLSASAACSKARSAVSVTTQFSAGSCFSRRARYIFVSSVEVTCLAARSAESVVTGSNARSPTDANFFASGATSGVVRRGSGAPDVTRRGRGGLKANAGSVSGWIATLRIAS